MSEHPLEHLNPLTHPSLYLKARLDDIKTGEIYAVPWPWPLLTNLAPSLLPGKLIVVAGSPGASKSFMMLQCLTFWLREGYLASALMLEGTKAEHLQRLLSQFECNSDMTDLKWIKDNPFLVDDAYNRHEEWMNEVGRHIQIPDMGNVTYYELLYWIETRAKAGDRVVIVDPITAASADGNIWEKDRELISTAQQLAMKYRISIIFVSHPKKDAVLPCLGSLANGSAYQRHTQCVLWMEAQDTKTVMTAGACGRHESEINRIMYLLKVTDGRGQGRLIGFKFDGGSLLLSEQGVIIKEKKGQKDE